MPCFWDDFVNSTDPSCFVVGEIFAGPTRTGDEGVIAFFSDAGLTTPIFPTVAEITHVKLYSQPGDMVDIYQCSFVDWVERGNSYGPPDYTEPWGTDGNADSRVYPPTLASPYTLVVDSDESISFDPTTNPNIFTIFDSLCPSPPYDRVGVFTIETDLGTCKYVAGYQACF